MWISRYIAWSLGRACPESDWRNPAVISVIITILLFVVPLAAVLLLDVLLGQIFWQTLRQPMARRERRLDEPTYPNINGPSLL